MRRATAAALGVASLAIAASAGGCRGAPHGKKIATLGDENVIVRFTPEDPPVTATSLVPVGGGRLLLAWSTTEGVRGVHVDGRGAPAGKPFAVSSVPARAIASAARGGCAGGGGGDGGGTALLLLAPFVGETEGGRPLELVEVGGDGGARRVAAEAGSVGPFCAGVALGVDCGLAFVARHTGRVGEFDVVAAGIDLASGERKWEKRLASPGSNAFGPALAVRGGRAAVAWIEKRLTFDKGSDDFKAGSVRVALLDAGGGLVRSPGWYGATVVHGAAPAIRWAGEGLVLLYKDHPAGEERDGLYFSAIDEAGRRTGGAVRVGRADGPGGPLLASPGGTLFSTVTLRKLAGDGLIGVNLVDGGGTRLQREIQVYSHRATYATIAAAALGRRLVLAYAGCRYDGCGLLTIAVTVGGGSDDPSRSFRPNVVVDAVVDLDDPRRLFSSTTTTTSTLGR